MKSFVVHFDILYSYYWYLSNKHNMNYLYVLQVHVCITEQTFCKSNVTLTTTNCYVDEILYTCVYMYLLSINGYVNIIML